MQHRFRTGSLAALALLASVAGLAVPGPADAQRPETIDLPNGFQGEGVATARHGTFFAGSRADGRIAIGSLRDGTSDVFVEDPLVPAATGLKADLRHGLLWVSGAATGQAAVYDLETGAGIETLTLTTAENKFVNDVIVTRDAAYFTDSVNPVIYRVPVTKQAVIGEPTTIELSGPASEFEAGEFNLNGIEATHDGRTLIVVNSFKGALYTVDAGTGQSEQIDLGGASVPTGDGILLHGRTLLVLQNQGGETAHAGHIDGMRLLVGHEHIHAACRERDGGSIPAHPVELLELVAELEVGCVDGFRRGHAGDHWRRAACAGSARPRHRDTARRVRAGLPVR